MRPLSFIIEIPDRPLYVPGSGPPMAPITLQPDDTETGWVIFGTVDYQGVPQYLVTPKDNSAHRRVVRREHILDWVSPKTYEDFEYARAKEEANKVRERDNKILAKAAAMKEKRYGMEQARKLAMSTETTLPTKKIKLEEGHTVNGKWHTSTDSEDEHSTTKIAATYTGDTKYKRSLQSHEDYNSTQKRRAISSPTRKPVLQQASLSTPVRLQQFQTRDYEGDDDDEDDVAVEDVDEIVPLPPISAPKRPPSSDHSILPPPKLAPGSRERYLSTNSSTTKTSVTKPPPTPHWSALGLPVYVSINVPNPAATTKPSEAPLPTSATFKDQLGGQREYPVILPPPKLSRSQPSSLAPISVVANIGGRRPSSMEASKAQLLESAAPKQQSAGRKEYPAISLPAGLSKVQASSFAPVDFKASLGGKRALSKPKRSESTNGSRSLFPKRETPATANSPQRARNNRSGKSRSPSRMGAMEDLDKSKVTPTGGRALTESHFQGGDTSRGKPRSLPGMGIDLTPPHSRKVLAGFGKLEHQKSEEPKSADAQVFAAPARSINPTSRRALKQGTGISPQSKREPLVNEDTDKDEETWMIHGILDDELRSVNGHMIRHYLIDWVGDYDPSWEPEKNIAPHAVSVYRKKQARRRGLDGALDSEDAISSTEETWKSAAASMIDNGVENGEEDADADIFMDAPLFITPSAETSRSGGGSVGEEDSELNVMFVKARSNY